MSDSGQCLYGEQAVAITSRTQATTLITRATNAATRATLGAERAGASTTTVTRLVHYFRRVTVGNWQERE